ncbi:ABC transporter permease [Candidatus Nitrosotalea sp. TS]|uniref:ABC transporter permease n=1 Tax=Candidatus Nitrosotalea sp. TS TaxID=2341020 RepID=UPI002104BCC7|nr:ABC transporter permease [Candidatus Nitrosotalea sp. TS]
MIQLSFGLGLSNLPSGYLFLARPLTPLEPCHLVIFRISSFSLLVILAQSVLFISIFYGITVVWEKDVGILTKLLSTPSPRSSIVLGKSLAAGLRGIFQAIMIFALALIIGVKIRFDPLDIAGVFAVVILFAMCFSSFSMFLASYLKTRDRMMGIGQALTMPLFFASNAIYPIAIMPIWLQYISIANPLSYVVDAIRSMLLAGTYENLPVDILVLVIATVVFVTLASTTIKKLLE